MLLFNILCFNDYMLCACYVIILDLCSSFTVSTCETSCDPTTGTITNAVDLTTCTVGGAEDANDGVCQTGICTGNNFCVFC